MKVTRVVNSSESYFMHLHGFTVNNIITGYTSASPCMLNYFLIWICGEILFQNFRHPLQTRYQEAEQAFIVKSVKNKNAFCPLK